MVMKSRLDESPKTEWWPFRKRANLNTIHPMHPQRRTETEKARQKERGGKKPHRKSRVIFSLKHENIGPGPTTPGNVGAMCV